MLLQRILKSWTFPGLNSQPTLDIAYFIFTVVWVCENFSDGFWVFMKMAVGHMLTKADIILINTVNTTEMVNQENPLDYITELCIRMTFNQIYLTERLPT